MRCENDTTYEKEFVEIPETLFLFDAKIINFKSISELDRDTFYI